MIEKDKANELANKFIFESIFDLSKDELKEARVNAKRCAIIAVDEILSTYDDGAISYLDYWLGVKKEIELL